MRSSYLLSPSLQPWHILCPLAVRSCLLNSIDTTIDTGRIAAGDIQAAAVDRNRSIRSSDANAVLGFTGGDIHRTVRDGEGAGTVDALTAATTIFADDIQLAGAGQGEIKIDKDAAAEPVCIIAGDRQIAGAGEDDIRLIGIETVVAARSIAGIGDAALAHKMQRQRFFTVVENGSSVFWITFSRAGVGEIVHGQRMGLGIVGGCAAVAISDGQKIFCKLLHTHIEGVCGDSRLELDQQNAVLGQAAGGSDLAIFIDAECCIGRNGIARGRSGGVQERCLVVYKGCGNGFC